MQYTVWGIPPDHDATPGFEGIETLLVSETANVTSVSLDAVIRKLHTLGCTAIRAVPLEALTDATTLADQWRKVVDRR
jgi:hypothetical protein